MRFLFLSITITINIKILYYKRRVNSNLWNKIKFMLGASKMNLEYFATYLGVVVSRFWIIHIDLIKPHIKDA